MKGLEIKQMGTLVLNVVTPSAPEMEGRKFVDMEKRKRIIEAPGSGWNRCRDWGLDGVMWPETMTELLRSDARNLMDPKSHAGKYAKAYGVYRKLGRLRVCLDGHERESWDVPKEV